MKKENGSAEVPQTEQPVLTPDDPVQLKQIRDIVALQKQAHSAMTGITELRVQIAELERLAKQRPEAAAPQPEGIYGVMIADIYCPDCGLKLDGNSATGPKFQHYVHPFSPSPRLGGEQCKLRGRKFLAPKIFLPMVP